MPEPLATEEVVAEAPATGPLTHSRSESQMVVTPLDEDGVTPKGIQQPLNEPKSAKLIGQEHTETKGGDEVNTNKES